MEINVNGDNIKKKITCKGDCKRCHRTPYLVHLKDEPIKWCYEYTFSVPKLIDDGQRKGGRVKRLDFLPKKEIEKLTNVDPIS